MKLSFLDATAEFPNRVALVFDGKEMSFSDLLPRVQHAIKGLQAISEARSISDGVALVANRDVASLSWLYAAMATGIPVVLLHPSLSPPERRRVLELVSPPLPVLGEEPIPEAGGTVVDQRARSSPFAGSRRTARTFSDNAILAVVFTSGTSGEPRGIRLGRFAFIASAEASAANLGWQQDDRWLLCVPFSHVSGLSILTRCLIARRTVVLAGGSGPFSGPEIAKIISRDRVTLLSLVPAQLTQLLDVPGWELPPSVRAILLGGAPASSLLLRRAADRGWPVSTTYGLTEACSQVTTQRYGTVNRGEQGSGEPLRGFDVRIVDGIIQVRSRTLMSGYFPAEAAPSPLTSDGWLITQDCGHFDTVGRLHVLGRRDDVIVTGGEKVHPAEIEAVLKSFDGVTDACVFGVPDERWGSLVAVALEVSSGAPSDMVLLDYVTRHLASFKRPRRLARLSAFPRRPNGKVDRRVLIAQATPLLTPLERR